MTNVTALIAKTHGAPSAVSSTPPITGPIMMPAFLPSPSRLFAHAMSSSRSTRLGIAAEDADQNGDSAIAETNANPINVFGASTKAIAKNTPAAIDSEHDHHLAAVVAIARGVP